MLFEHVQTLFLLERVSIAKKRLNDNNVYIGTFFPKKSITLILVLSLAIDLKFEIKSPFIQTHSDYHQKHRHSALKKIGSNQFKKFCNRGKRVPQLNKINVLNVDCCTFDLNPPFLSSTCHLELFPKNSPRGVDIRHPESEFGSLTMTSCVVKNVWECCSPSRKIWELQIITVHPSTESLESHLEHSILEKRRNFQRTNGRFGAFVDPHGRSLRSDLCLIQFRVVKLEHRGHRRCLWTPNPPWEESGFLGCILIRLARLLVGKMRIEVFAAHQQTPLRAYYEICLGAPSQIKNSSNFRRLTEAACLS